MQNTLSERGIHMANEKTANQRHDELQEVVAAQRERLRNNPDMRRSTDALTQSVAILLAGRAVKCGDLHEVSTVKAVNETWQRNLDYFDREAKEFIEKTGAEEILRLELLKTGQVPQLVVSYRDHTNAAQRLEPGKPLAEPEKQEPEAEAGAEAGAGGNG